MEQEHDKNELKKAYQALQKKYGLPEFGSMDNGFFISKLEESEHLLRDIIGKMNERLEHAQKLLGEIIQPENNMASLSESEAYNENDKKHIFELYKQTCLMHRELDIIDFDYNDKKASRTINQVFKKWQELKPEIARILEKARDSWKASKKSRLELEYFG